jgi:hypothetical protein
MTRYLDAVDAIRISTQNMKLLIPKQIDRSQFVIFVGVKMSWIPARVQ